MIRAIYFLGVLIPSLNKITGSLDGGLRITILNTLRWALTVLCGVAFVNIMSLIYSEWERFPLEGS